MSRNILIVDDEEWICHLLKDYLADQGYSVQTALNLDTARKYFGNGNMPDIAVLDVMLPDGNGIDFLAELRSQPHTVLLPVIMISAHRVETKDRISGFETGADDYLIKPFDLKEFKFRIERLLARNDRVKKESAQAAAVQVPPPAPPPASPAPVPTQAAGPFNAAPPKKSGSRFDEIFEEEENEISPAAGGVPDSFFKRLVQYWKSLLLTPGDFVKNDLPGFDIKFVNAFVGIFSIALGAQAGLADKSIPGFLVTGSAAAAVAWGLMAAVAWAVQWGFGLKGRAIKMRPLLVGLSMGWAPMVLASLLGLIYVAVAGGKPGDFTAGPLLILPMQASSPGMGFLLRRLDLLELWGVALAGWGFAVNAGFPVQKTIRRVLMIWLGLLILFALVGAFV